MGSELQAGVPFFQAEEDGLAYQLAETSLSLGAVEPDELAFALSLFMGAATLRLGPVYRPVTEAHHLSLRTCAALFSLLTSPVPHSPGPRRTASRGESTLQEAFWQLWHHLEGDPGQLSVCARVLGFYGLMERTGGAAVAQWMEACPEDPSQVTLHPAVVHALSAIPLGSKGNLDEGCFQALIHSFANEQSELALAGTQTAV